MWLSRASSKASWSTSGKLFLSLGCGFPAPFFLTGFIRTMPFFRALPFFKTWPFAANQTMKQSFSLSLYCKGNARETAWHCTPIALLSAVFQCHTVLTCQLASFSPFFSCCLQSMPFSRQFYSPFSRQFYSPFSRQFYSPFSRQFQCLFSKQFQCPFSRQFHLAGHLSIGLQYLK